MGIDKLGMNKLQLHRGNVRLDTPDGTKKEAVHQFESYLVQMMVREMRKSVPKGMFDSPSMEMFVDLLDQSLAEQITESGGLGFADALERSLGMRDMEESDLLSGGSFSSQIEKALGGQSGMSSNALSARSLHSIASVEGLEHLPLPKLPSSDIFQGVPAVSEKAIFPVEGRISSRFGHRIDPLDGHEAHHKGLDIAATEGTPIKAMRSGTVTFSGTRGGYGKVVIIDHGNGLESRYAHCAHLDVRVGQHISAGAPIATVGSTGRSTGAHLHLEVRKNGTAVNPMNYLSSQK
jgi:murein DD-endopeptidase MepM/ murein hydrolase activator NlpD